MLVFELMNILVFRLITSERTITVFKYFLKTLNKSMFLVMKNV